MSRLASKYIEQLSKVYIAASKPFTTGKHLFIKRTSAVLVISLAIVATPQLLSSQSSPSSASAFDASTLVSLLQNTVSSSSSNYPTLQRVTGSDMAPCSEYQVCGTDLGIPYRLENGSVGYLFGDTFTSPLAGGAGWRSNVMLRSTTIPTATTRITFDSAAGIAGPGHAPELIQSAKDVSKQGEFTIIPTDGISFPENGEHIISYMNVRTWDSLRSDWETNESGLAWSNDGNNFHRIGPVWTNNGNTDPNQMMSLQRDGDYVYIVSVRGGRQYGPMNLQRVPWDQMFDKDLYECWDGYGWGSGCEPLFSGVFGEPSLRKLDDGTWVLAYLNLAIGSIVTRYADDPTGPWSTEKMQINGLELPNLYGGFIHPDSTRDNLTLMVSTWTNNRYDVNQLSGATLTGVHLPPIVR